MTDDPHLSAPLRRNMEALAARARHEAQTASSGDRIAAAITRFTGSLGFVMLHLILYGAWIIANLGWLPGVPRFDPTFVILASEASVEAIFLSTFVLINQNRMAAAADRRAELDLHVSLLVEHELTRVARLMDAIADRLDIAADARPPMAEVKRDIRPERVLDELESYDPDGERRDAGPDAPAG